MKVFDWLYREEGWDNNNFVTANGNKTLDGFVCTACGSIGKPIKTVKGNFFTEIVLWCFLLLPGLIYTTWRLTSKYKACPKCGKPTMIPMDTPTGKALIQNPKAKKIEKPLGMGIL